MKPTNVFFFLFFMMLGGDVFAHGDGHKNLKVLPQHAGKNLDKGMKLLSKGLGVKCVACHVKGKWDKDDRSNKLAARTFLKSAVSETDAEKRKAALASLLEAMKLKTAKDEKKIWTALSAFKTKASDHH